MSRVSADAGPAGRGPQAAQDGLRYGAGFRALTGTSLAAAYLLVVLGDTVRVTESGMGCSSWPLCNGHIGLAGAYQALLEQSHRYLAAVLTTLVVAVFVAAWRHRGDRFVFWSAAAAVGLIGVQIMLGAVTVFTQNAGWTVALHLAGAWLVMGAVTVTALGTWRPAAPATRAGPGAVPRARGGRLGFVAALALFALSVSGMLVLHDGASDACPGWPVCGGGAGSAGLVALQYLHRSLALVAGVLVVAAAAREWLAGGRALAVATVTLLGGTAAFGAVVATTGAPDSGQALHLAVASALWIAVVALATPAPARGSPATSARASQAGAQATSAGAAQASKAGAQATPAKAAQASPDRNARWARDRS